ncbi:alkaline shock response membrane anchor protein AmaP, partial [Streptomonospora algeriensis]
MTTVEDALSGPDPATVRRANRVAVHTFRPRRSWPALIVGAIVLVVAALAAVEIASTLAGAPLRTAVTSAAGEYAAGARWSDPLVRTASAVAAVIGLVLIAV